MIEARLATACYAVRVADARAVSPAPGRVVLAPAVQRLLSIAQPGFRVTRGSPLPFGATLVPNGVNFSIFARHATAVTLVLFQPGEFDPTLELPLDPRRHRTGDVWHALLEGINPEVEFGYRIGREPNPKPHIHRYSPEHVLLDPWTRTVSGPGPWSVSGPRRCAIPTGEFDWRYDQPLNTPLADSVIYELHVRGFTIHPSSGVTVPGTFSGLAEKIPYLKELGVTAVELLPVHEFDETDCDRVNPGTGEALRNFWGYQPIAFFAPNRGYASVDRTADPAVEFKRMVKTFHDAGIEIILDVVFNHTAEGNERGTTQSFRGIDNSVYYMIHPDTGAYLDYTGTGNSLNCNHPVVREMIRNCLRYWVMEMHVDGFRFDLASVLGRAEDGSVLTNPPLLEMLAKDPILSQTKLIAEAWDAGGLYQVGSFPAWSRWAEWNGKFRDDLRRFVRGDAGMVPALAARLAGSPDLYQHTMREPWHSINFVTCHDGFTLADLVSFNEKHNEPNGEWNLDGASDNFSWNCGTEGPTEESEIMALRQRQAKNLLTLLLMSHGVPMLLAGDEFGRTQSGNNNAYCQDNEISWIDWGLAKRHADLLRFVQRLVAFRAQHPILRRQTFAGEEVRIDWHGVRLSEPDWSWHSRSLAMHVSGSGDHVYVIANAYWESLGFELPQLEGSRWIRVFDTALNGYDEPVVMEGRSVTAAPRSVIVLTAISR